VSFIQPALNVQDARHVLGHIVLFLLCTLQTTPHKTLTPIHSLTHLYITCYSCHLIVYKRHFAKEKNLHRRCGLLRSHEVDVVQVHYAVPAAVIGIEQTLSIRN